jgi:uncharacterized phage protein (TIGR01671 family)|nr:MAG TPA: YopX protein [Caudoviricetes sp.]
MNREIKFRVWDKYEKQMYPISSIDYDIFSQEIRIIAVGHKNGMCTAYNKNHNSEKCDITALELMQYTGIHDIKGKEIYESMIINNEYIVVYNFSKFALKNKNNGNIIDFERNKNYEITGEYFE